MKKIVILCLIILYCNNINGQNAKKESAKTDINASNVHWKYPKPTGKFQVGTTLWKLKDCSRKEKLIENKSCRKFAVRVWYPATEAESFKKLGFFEGYDLEKVASLFVKQGIKPKKLQEAAQNVKTNSYVNATKISKNKLPVLLFSHGYGHSIPELYFSLAEEAASNGYLVLGINYPYESISTKFSNNESVFLDVETNQKSVTTLFSQAGKLIKLPNLPNDLERKKLLMEVIGSLEYLNNRHGEWVLDNKYLLEYLKKINKNKKGVWYNKIDLKKIGAIGHSFGGATAVQLMMDEDLVKSSVNLDGLQIGNIINRNVNKPTMMVSSKVYQGLSDPVFEGSDGPIYFIHPGSKFSMHNVYTDMVLWPENYFINRKQSIGEIDDGESFVRMNNELIMSFFEQTLNDTKVDLTRILKKYDQLNLAK